MKILITGVAGFVGFSIANKLLKDKRNFVYGIDNFDNYYSIKYKKKRLSQIIKKKNFFFKYIDIRQKSKIQNLFKNNYFDVVMHFAAQAGVRYSLINPKKYIEVNKKGFENLLNALKEKPPQKIIFASSSSVYGNSKKLPTNEKNILKPNNVYAKTKINNEKLAKMYKKKFGLNICGLRFFTVYGEWGRPDMLILKLLKHAEQKKIFYLNGNGNYWRDFTYINDVVDIIYKLSKTNFKQDQIYNICNSKPVHIGKLVKILSKKINFNKIVSSRKNNIEVFKTHGCNKKVLKLINKKNFHNCFDQLDKIINWHNKYKHLI